MYLKIQNLYALSRFEPRTFCSGVGRGDERFSLLEKMSEHGRCIEVI
jgi:hypothetical protein